MLLAREVGHGKVVGVEAVEELVLLAHFVADHRQVEHLDEVRDVEPRRLQMLLIPTVSLGLGRVAILELLHRTLEAPQQGPRLVQGLVRSRLMLHITGVRHRFLEGGDTGFVGIGQSAVWHDDTGISVKR